MWRALPRERRRHLLSIAIHRRHLGPSRVLQFFVCDWLMGVGLVLWGERSSLPIMVLKIEQLGEPISCALLTWCIVGASCCSVYSLMACGLMDGRQMGERKGLLGYQNVKGIA